MAIQSNFPAIKPSLMLDFANTKQLDPRITYTRASTATFYNGVSTAKAEENLVLQSQTFDNASWVKTTATVTADSFAAPDGTTTADTLTATNTNATLLQTFTAIATAYTFSVYIYRKTGTGNVDITVDGTTYATQSISGAWVRYSITTTPTAGSKTAGIRLATNGDEVYIWGAQLENRSSATAYTVTTTQAITNYIPVLQSAASGVARFDNNPTTGESLGLLIEESRTNLLTYSEQFDNAGWSKNQSNVSANIAVAPDGTLTADKLFDDSTASSVHRLVQTFTVVNGTIYTLSVYAKAAERTFIALQLSLGFANTPFAFFNLTSGTVGTTTGSPSATITPVGNGWYRCTITATGNTSGAGAQPYIYLASADGTTNYTGNGFSGVFLWGAQLEAGAFATSYIPTVASQVTRAADAASMTGTNFTSWYNTAEGTLFADAISNGGQVYAQIGVGSISDDRVSLYSLSPNLAVVSGSTTSAALGSTTLNNGTSAKLAGAYKTNDFALSINGATVLTDTSGLLPAPTSLLIGARNSASPSNQLNGTIKKVAYYPIRLSNTNLVALTS